MLFNKANKQNIKTEAGEPISLPPSGFKLVLKELLKDKFAIFSILVLVLILLFTFF